MDRVWEDAKAIIEEEDQDADNKGESGELNTCANL